MPPPPPADSPTGASHADHPAAWDGVIDRRGSGRLPARPGVRLEVRRWADGLEPDIALRLLDATADGVRVQLPVEPEAADLFEVAMWDADGVERARVLAGVRWWRREPDGVVTAGLVFGRALPPAAVTALAEQIG
jgi:hypothetical protein